VQEMLIRGISEEKIRRDILSGLEKIRELEIFSGIDRIMPGQLISTDPVQAYLFASENITHDRLLRPIILDAVITSELLAGGSGELCLSLIFDLLSSCIKDMRKGKSHNEIIRCINSCEDRWVSHLKSSGRKLDRSAFDKLISEINDDFCQSIIDIVMKLSDIKTAVHVEKSNAVNTTVELFSGSSFCVGADTNFLMGKNLWERKNVRSIMIDGMIESIGEIHHLLEKAAETKEPYVIFSRDMSPDVLHTLYVNIQRRTIDVLPVCVGLDENTINILNDIAIVCGGDIVSSYKGDLIASAVKDELPISDFISVSNKGVVIRNDKTKKDVTDHMRYLEKKRNSQREAALRVVFDDRLKAMCSNKIVVNVGTSARFKNRSTIENLDKFYRMCQPLLRYGFLKTDELEILHSQHQKYGNIVHENIVKSGKIISTLGACIAVKNAASSVKSICSVGYALVKDS
jgi:hypothetical protein